MKKIIISGLFVALLLPLTPVHAAGITFGASGSTAQNQTAPVIVKVATSATKQAVVTTATSNSYCVALTSDLRYGMTSFEVTRLQQFLKTQGLLSVNPTGYFGDLTIAAVRKFQATRTMPATGFVGASTREQIKAESCGTTVATSNYQTAQPEETTAVSSAIGGAEKVQFVSAATTTSSAPSRPANTIVLQAANDITPLVIQHRGGSGGGGGVWFD